MITPLLYIWGDDELVAERLIGRFARGLAAELGEPLERWDLRGELATAALGAAQLRERLATGTMFGGGTLAVVTKPGALVKRNDTRDEVLRAIEAMAPGNALVIVEAIERAGQKGPGIKRLADAITAAGGVVAAAPAPRPGNLASWLEAEARERAIPLASGAARAIAERLGSRVTEGDVDRRYLSRIASNELEKVALRHAIDGGPVTVEDVEDLVAREVPGSLFALTDAVGNRQGPHAVATLDRLLREGRPEPLLLTVLHRRIRDILMVGGQFASGAKASEVIAATGLHPFVVGKMQEMAARWTDEALTRALGDLVELDAMAKGVPGSESTDKQRALALMLWAREHATPERGGGRRAGPG